ncbi:MAG TPA: MFS transporter [Methanosarcinaceae archaeon]|nr:MFS transporter [Methanosarcinaceae archaeon]
MDTDKILLYASVFVMMGLSDAAIPVLPELAAADHIHYGPIASSLLFSSYFLGALVTMLPFGILAVRYGNLRFIFLGVFLTVISGSLIMLSNNMWIISIARFIEGSACGAFFPAAFSMLSEFKNRNRCMGEFTFLLNAGLATGVAISGLLAKNNIKSGILIFTIASGIVLALALPKFVHAKPLITKHSRPKQLHGNIREEISIEIKKTISTLFDSRFINIWILSFILFGSTGVLVAFYPDYSAGILTKTELGATIAGLYVSAMITSLVVSRSFIGYNTMIRAGMGISAIGALIAIQHPLPGFIILGAGSGVAMVGLPIAASHMDADRGLAMGLFNTCTYGGLAIMPLITGAFIGQFGFELIFYANALILGASVLLRK